MGGVGEKRAAYFGNLGSKCGAPKRLMNALKKPRKRGRVKSKGRWINGAQRASRPEPCAADVPVAGPTCRTLSRFSPREGGNSGPGERCGKGGILGRAELTSKRLLFLWGQPNARVS